MATESGTETDSISEAWGILYSLKDKDYPIQYLTGVKESFSKSSERRGSDSGRRNSLVRTTNGSRVSKMMTRNRHARLFKIKMVQDEQDADKIVVVSKVKQGLSVDGKVLTEGSESTVENGRCEIRVEDLGLELVFEAFYETTKRTTLTELTDHRIMSVLGKGAYGIVYKAFRTENESFCVVKASINLELDDFANEYKCLKELDHEGIIKTLGFRRSPYVTFLFTELGQGGSLHHRLKDRGRMSEMTARHAFVSIADALRYLHGNGLVHRDVKPQNIVLMSCDEVSGAKLIDFGLCCREGDRKAMRMIAGATRYMAPEMLHKEISEEPTLTTSKIDVWGFGVCLFTALTRRDPFKYSSDKQEFLDRIMSNELRTDVKGYAKLTSPTKALISACLHPDPSKRASAQQLMSFWDDRTPSSGPNETITSVQKTALRS